MAWCDGMRSSEPIQAPLRWLASGVAGLLAALLAACTAVPAPVGDRFLPDCAVARLQGEASRRSEFETLRRNVEAGALQLVAALPGPAEFDAATPREVVWRIEGLRDREDRDWQRTAQLAAWVFGMVGSKVTANKLLGKDD